MADIDSLTLVPVDGPQEFLHLLLNVRLHLVHTRLRKDWVQQLATLLMLGWILHVEDSMARHAAVDWSLWIFRVKAVELIDDFDAGEAEFVRSDLHNRPIMLVEVMDGSSPIAAKVNEEQPVAGELGKERARNVPEWR